MSTLTVYDASKMTKPDILSAWKSWQVRTFVTIWITYGTFYLCRANMSFALPGLKDGVRLFQDPAGPSGHVPCSSCIP